MVNPMFLEVLEPIVKALHKTNNKSPHFLMHFRPNIIEKLG